MDNRPEITPGKEAFMPFDSTAQRDEQVAHTTACIAHFNDRPGQRYGLYHDVDVEALTKEDLDGQSVAYTVLAPIADVIGERTSESVTTIGDIMRATGLTRSDIDEIACDCGIEDETTSSKCVAALLKEHLDRLEGN